MERKGGVRVIRNIKSMFEYSTKNRLEGETIGFVPTMGALHAGHVSLIRRASKDNDLIVVSIFVNPAQFGPREDFKKYPRNLRQDARLCKKAGVDVIFYPDIKEMYPADFKTYITVEHLSDVLCGQFRPGHFKGVATVVVKLFNIVSPNIAYFGQKDAQQAVIIKRMVEDLDIPVKIRVMPTVREKDGLAMSSRNAYLSKDERKQSLVLYQALRLAKELVKQGKRDPRAIIQKMRRLISKKRSAKIQYIAIVDLKDLKPVDKIKDKVLITQAVWLGKTRLIDNIIINPN